MKTPSIKYLAIAILWLSCTKESLQRPNLNSNGTANESALQINSHFIGERFGGGVIVYLTKGGNHGLIADTVDLGNTAWYNGTFITTGATGLEIGTGKENTRKIISAQGRTGNYAALLCAQSKRSGYTDWFLPSLGELNQIYKHKDVVGVFPEYYVYWSSSEYDSSLAWHQYLYTGFKTHNYKAALFYVRAVRSF